MEAILTIPEVARYAKEDTAEVLAPLHLTTGLVLALAIGLLASTVGLTWSVWQQAQKRYYWAAYTAEQARREAEHRVHEQNELLQVQNEELKAQREELQSQNEELRAQQQELQQTEATLRESEARYRSLIHNLLEGFADCQMLFEDGQPRDFVYLEVNPAFEQLTGLKNVVGRRVTDVIPGMQKAEPGLFEAYGRVAQTGRPEHFEIHFHPLDLWLAISVYSPEKGYFVAVFDNITDRVRSEQERQHAELLIQAQKEQLVAQNEELVAQNEELVNQGRALADAEADLQQANSELEQRIQARSAQLSAANSELALANAALLRANQMKDEFLANMSHELRTPLTGILGLAEVMDMGIYGAPTDEQRHALHLMQASGEHLLQLINDILDLAKVEAGKVELHVVPVPVDEVCQAGLEFIKQAAHQKNQGLSFHLDPQVRVVQADQRRLKQMLVNLLSNAVKFTPEGGRVGLEVAGDPGRQQVHFTVWDTGIGVPPEKQALLFQPFVQLNGSLARKYEGTGLGLALVRSMAELHGGSVAVESAGLGQGSRFTISLPWEAEVPAPKPASTGAAEATSGLVSLAALLGRPPLILAVDDNPTILLLLTN